MEVFWTSQDIDNKNYMEVGIDDDFPVLYVYKDGELFDFHVSMETSFSQEMNNIINCYLKTHKKDPAFNDIIRWRQWFKLLKDNSVIH